MLCGGSSVSSPSSPSLYGSGAPTIHLTSSGSSAWGWVLRRCWVLRRRPCHPCPLVSLSFFAPPPPVFSPPPPPLPPLPPSVVPLPCPLFVVSSPRPFPLSLSPRHPRFIIVPPTVHPPSSCSWGWGRVVCHSLPLSVVV